MWVRPMPQATTKKMRRPEVVATTPGQGGTTEPSVASTSFPPVVSSAHLAAGGSPALSELEYGLILAGHAFNRWMSRCMTAAGRSGLSTLEILILHTVCHRDRPKKLADICLVLDVEDTHLATYAIRKLAEAGLVKSGRQGKEKMVEITETGLDLCRRYAEIREALLVKALRASGPLEGVLSDAAAQLRAVSGYYEQAARAAATL
jgi:predicted MarR family transcription regulator